MGQYNKAVLTTAGEKLIARALAGEIELSIIKVKTSDYEYPVSTDLKSMTDMQGIKQTVRDPETTVLYDTIIQTRALFSNEEIAYTYYIYNIGLYALDGTDEVLFCIVTAETPDEMPKYNGVASTSYIYNIQNVVEEAGEISITVNSSGVATIQSVRERVNSDGGDISETVIGTLEKIEDKYPLPVVGENLKRFLGKILTFLKNIRPLTGDITLFVSANTGSDIGGDGSELNPYASIGKALNIIPKNLGGFVATINITAGEYAESIYIQNFVSGTIRINLTGDVTVQNMRVINSYVICTTSGSINTLTLSWIYLTTKANMYSSDVNFQVHTTGSFASSDTPSIFINDGSVFYIPGLTTLDTHTGAAVVVQHHAKAYFGSVQGSGFDVGFGAYFSGKCTCVYNNLSAVKPIVAGSGGIFIKSSGAVVGSLQSDVTYYVANTGSDIIGNGTSGNPFMTIQHAIDILPKDLGGYVATIKVAAGSYPESVNIVAFHSGSLNLFSDTKDTLAGTCRVSDFTVSKWGLGYLRINGFNITNPNYYAIYVNGSYGVYISYCQSTVSAPLKTGIQCNESYCSIDHCKIANRNHAASFSNSIGVSLDWDSGSNGNLYGISSINGSKVSMIGVQATSKAGIINDRLQEHGGTFFYQNGTQITGPIASGISCTWGTITGGYVRHGNLFGDAMVTIQIGIVTNTNLLSNGTYKITGFPTPVTGNCVVTFGPQNVVSNCYLNGDTINFNPSINLNSGSGLLFNCTYKTNV